MRDVLAAFALLALAAASSAQEREVRREVAADGTVLVEAEFVRGPDGAEVLDGKYASFFADGSRDCTGLHREGERHGTWKYWFPDGGRKRAQGKYDDGWRSGKWQVWDEGGELDPDASGTYVVLEVSFPSGAPRARGELLDGEPHGRWVLWWDGGHEMARGELVHARPHGAWLFRHGDGTLDPAWITGRYEGGRRVGALAEGELPAATEAPDPTRLAPLAFDPALVDELRDAGRRALVRFRAGGDEALTAAQELRALGLRADALVLAELLTLDPASEADVELGRRLELELLAPLVRQSAFGWRAPQGPEDVAHNRWTLVRWHSLLQLARLDPSLLEVELPWAARRALGSQPTLLDLHPPLPLPAEALAGAGSFLEARLSGKRDLKARGGAGTEQALADALAWLVRHQALDGRWSAAEFMHANSLGRSCDCDGPGNPVHDVGVTSLALLALLGDGNTPRSGPHAAAVARGVAWLLEQQLHKTGQIGQRRSLYFVYDHAIATQALCEALGVTGSEALREPAARAVGFILKARNPYSAWRYDVPPEGKNDTSVTAWMLSALAAARDAGLAPDPEALYGGLAWLDEVTDPVTGRCGYDRIGSLSARVSRVNDQYPTDRTEAMTAAALHCRLLLGQAPDEHPIVAKHADLLAKALPEWTAEGYGRSACNDMYYWYYGSQAMFLVGGARYWEPWNKAMKSALVDSQRRDGDHAGSWDPNGPWGTFGGRVYATAMMALCLESYYRYPRPLDAR